MESFDLDSFFPKYQLYCSSFWSTNQSLSSLAIKNEQLVTALVKVCIFIIS